MSIMPEQHYISLKKERKDKLWTFRTECVCALHTHVVTHTPTDKKGHIDTHR